MENFKQTSSVSRTTHVNEIQFNIFHLQIDLRHLGTLALHTMAFEEEENFNSKYITLNNKSALGYETHVLQNHFFSVRE
jgi:hypothetical protein